MFHCSYKKIFTTLTLILTFVFSATVHAELLRISEMGTDGTTTFNALTPDIAYDSENNQYLAVWSADDDSLVDGEFEIWGQLITSNHELSGNMFRISSMGTDGNTNFSATAPKVEYNSQDHTYLVVWKGDHNSGSLVDDEFEIWGQVVNADGTLEGSNFRISTMGDDGDANFTALEPDLVYNQVGNEFLVVWHGDHNMNGLVDDEFEIWGQIVEASGSLSGANFRISSMGTNGDTSYTATSGHVAFNATDEQYFVVWRGSNDVGDLVPNEYEVWGQIISSNGVLSGSEIRISSMGTDGNTTFNAYEPKISYSSESHTYMVIWNADDNSLLNDKFEIWGQVLDSTGTLSGDEIRISSMGTDENSDHDASDADLAYNSVNDVFLITWYANHNAEGLAENEFEIYTKSYFPDGTERTSQARLSEMGGIGNIIFEPTNPKLTFNSAENEFFIVWSGDNNIGNLVDEELEIWGESFTHVEVCGMGYFSDSGDNGGEVNGCTPCPTGEYQDITGQTACIPCASGYFQADTGGRYCYACDYGTYQPDEGQTSCINCPAGTYQNEQGQSECLDCEAGHFQNSTGAISCFECEAGTYQDETGQLECKLCPEGRAQELPAQTTCNTCDSGSYSSTEGETSCELCEVGTYAEAEGSTECLSCPVGTYASDTGSAQCVECSAGTYADTASSSECSTCPEGTFSLAGASECTLCPEGTTSQAGASECTVLAPTTNAQSSCQLSNQNEKSLLDLYGLMLMLLTFMTLRYQMVKHH